MFVLLLTMGYLVYVNRQHLFFWKYTRNSIEEKIDKVLAVTDTEKRIKGLKEVAEVLTHYKEDSPVLPSAFFLSGKVNFQIAENYIGKSFSELFIKGETGRVSSAAKKYFIRSIRDFRKGAALLDGNDMKLENTLMFSKALFYTGYVDFSELWKFVSGNVTCSEIRNTEDHRFYGTVQIFAGRHEAGLEYLDHNGVVDEGVQGLLFISSARFAAEKYTNAIMSYREILERTKDSEILKLVHVCLGKIYYNQSLYSESLSHFNSALKIDELDSVSKVWIGKNYAALGYRDRARAIWSEVLSVDRTNAEVKELLDII